MEDQTIASLHQILEQLGNIKAHEFYPAQIESVCEAMSLIRSILPVEPIDDRPLQLFHLCRTDRIDYDQYDSFIVAAPGLDEARMLAVHKMWDERYWNWDTSTATVIGAASVEVQPGILSSSFNAG